MGKNVLIISSSPRKGGNSETLAASFAKGAGEAGHKVEMGNPNISETCPIVYIISPKKIYKKYSETP